MTRYFTHRAIEPRCAPEGQFHDPLLPALCASDHEPTFTGIVDRNGNRIMRGPNEMGFNAKL